MGSGSGWLPASITRITFHRDLGRKTEYCCLTFPTGHRTRTPLRNPHIGQILFGDKVAEGDVWVGGIAIFFCIPSIDLGKEKVVVNARINSDSFLRTEIREAGPPFPSSPEPQCYDPQFLPGTLRVLTANSAHRAPTKRLSQGKGLTQ